MTIDDGLWPYHLILWAATLDAVAGEALTVAHRARPHDGLGVVLADLVTELPADIAGEVTVRWPDLAEVEFRPEVINDVRQFLRARAQVLRETATAMTEPDDLVTTTSVGWGVAS